MSFMHVSSCTPCYYLLISDTVLILQYCILSEYFPDQYITARGCFDEAVPEACGDAVVQWTANKVINAGQQTVLPRDYVY